MADPETIIGKFIAKFHEMNHAIEKSGGSGIQLHEIEKMSAFRLIVIFACNNIVITFNTPTKKRG